MLIKNITKQFRENLDTFIQGSPVENTNVEQPITSEQQIKNKKVLKKTDGLIERIDNKVFITEDNRQLLQD